MENEEVKSGGLKKAYFHINNGGITFEVDGRYMKSVGIYPLLRISASHFGHKTSEMEVTMTPAQMKAMGEWLLAEAEHADNFADAGAKDSSQYPFMEMMVFEAATGRCEFEKGRERCCEGDCQGHGTEDEG